MQFRFLQLTRPKSSLSEEKIMNARGMMGRRRKAPSLVWLDTKPLSASEAQGDLVEIQTLLLLICKSFSCYANKFLVSITSRSIQTSL